MEDVEVVAELKRETPAAYGVVIEDDSFEGEAEIIWLPKSQVTKDGNTFYVPEWLAIEKGLV